MVAPRNTHSDPLQGTDHGAAWRPSLGFLALAVGIVSAGLTYYVMVPTPLGDIETPRVTLSPEPAQDRHEPVQTANLKPTVPVTQAAISSATMLPVADGNDPTPDLSHYVNPGEKPTMQEVISRLHQANVHTGLAAFSPPGTRPNRVGLAVPEDFVLPQGYVRHHQATDDGQRVEAILMFAPDHQLLDTNQQPIEMPKDRVVPPHLAPPGFPLRSIVIPAPAGAGRP